MNGRNCDGRLVLVLFTGIALSSPRRSREDAATRLTVERIFQAARVRATKYPSVRWLSEGPGYTTLEDSKETPGGQDLVAYDAATGKQRVLVPAAHLIPPREIAPLPVDGYALSEGSRPAADLHQLEAGLAAEHPRRLLGARPGELASCGSWAAMPRLRR